MLNLPIGRFAQLKRAPLCSSLCLVAASPLLAAFSVHAQSVPIPFAGLLAGGGPVCSNSLPVFAVSGTGAKYGDGCPATQATFNTPVALATDTFGDVFVADQTYQLVRVIYNGSPALAAALIASNVQNPGLVPVKGNIYTIAGGVTTTPSNKYCNEVSGTSGLTSSLDGCPGAETEQGPRGLATDADGNLFIASVSPSSEIRVLYVGGTKAAALITLENPTVTTPQVGYVYTIAGANSSAYAGDGALAVKASLNTPRGIFVDANENVYFSDELNNVIRVVSSSTGFISTVAGHSTSSISSCSGVAPAGDGSSATATTTSLACPYGQWLDQYGNIFIAEAGTGSASNTVPGRIRVVYEGGTLAGITSPTVGNIYTYAGGPPTASTTAITPAQSTIFQEVFGVTIDPAGYLYVTDYRTGSSGSNHIWRVDPTSGNIADIAGNSTTTLTVGARCNGGVIGPVATDKYGDGCPATQAYLQNPQESLGFTANGAFYVTDRANNLIRSFSYDNIFPATAVGSSMTQAIAFLYPAASLPVAETFTTEGVSTTDYSDAGGDTCVLNATLPAATTCVDYVKFAPTAVGARNGSMSVTTATTAIGTQTLSGVGSAPILAVSPVDSSFTIGSNLQPLGISTDQNGNVYISDGKGKQVLRASQTGGATTVVVSSLGAPRETTTDPFGNIFIADSTANTVVEHTVTGSNINLGSGLSGPQGVAADFLGNLYIADTGNNRLVYLLPATGIQRVVPTAGIALKAPTSLALDVAGDLFILDTNSTRLIEIPLGAGPQVVSLPTGATPAAIAFDPAGDSYLADTASGSILLVPAGSTTATAIATGLTTPSGIAIGLTGNIYVADSAAGFVTVYNQNLNASTFATTNISLTSLPVTLTLSNLGNGPGTLASPTFVETGSASAFPASGTPTCVGSFVLSPAATCAQSFVFSPTVPGAQTAKVVFSTTTGQSATSNFSATATNLVLTSTTLAPLSSTVSYGQAVTYTATLTPKSTGTSTPTGTITFVVDGTTVKPVQSVTTVPYTYTYTFATTPLPGVHSIAVSYSGDALYAASNASTLLTVTKAPTTTTSSSNQTAAGTALTATVTPTPALTATGIVAVSGTVVFYVDGTAEPSIAIVNGVATGTFLIADGSHTFYATYSGDTNYTASTSATQNLSISRTPTTTTLTIKPISNNGAGSLQLSAKIATTGAGTPSGTVTFFNGSTQLGQVNLSTAVNGVVTFNTPIITYTNYAFTATYSGDGLFQPSFGSATEGPDFVVVAPATVLAVPQGGQAIETISVAPINGYTGTLTASCSDLPVNTLCRVQPTPLTLATTASGTLSVQVFVGVNPNVASLDHPDTKPSRTWLAVFLLAPVVFGLRRRKLLAAKSLPWLVAIATLAVLPALSGCGNKTPAYSAASFSTPAGTYALTLIVTDTNNVARSAVFNISVNSQ
jgi:sugar lactone lactonase YvrE